MMNEELTAVAKDTPRMMERLLARPDVREHLRLRARRPSPYVGWTPYEFSAEASTGRSKDGALGAAFSLSAGSGRSIPDDRL
jgi:hypothetical protein